MRQYCIIHRLIQITDVEGTDLGKTEREKPDDTDVKEPNPGMNFKSVLSQKHPLVWNLLRLSPIVESIILARG